MLYAALLCVSSALASYTIGPENRLTTQSTTTESIKWFSVKKLVRGGSNYTYDSETGEITCDTAEKAVSNCDILLMLKDYGRHISQKVNYLGQHLTSVEERVLEVLGHLQEVRGTLHSRPGRSVGARTVCEAVHNATRAISEELDTLKGRQAASAALQVAMFFLFVGYLLTLSVLYAVKKCKKHRKRQAEEEVELMEQKLQERKAKRRAAASRAKGGPLPTQE